MRMNRMGYVILSFIVLAIGLVLPASAFAGEKPGSFAWPYQWACSEKPLEGTFVYAAQGVGQITSSQFSPLGFAGFAKYDGKGNLEGSDRVNFGSGAFKRVYTGTYAPVDRKASRDECEFTATFTWLQDIIDTTGHVQTVPMSANVYMVLADDGKSVMAVNTDPQPGAPAGTPAWCWLSKLKGNRESFTAKALRTRRGAKLIISVALRPFSVIN
jgi:hypothetical protein